MREVFLYILWWYRIISKSRADLILTSLTVIYKKLILKTGRMQYVSNLKSKDYKINKRPYCILPERGTQWVKNQI